MAKLDFVTSGMSHRFLLLGLFLFIPLAPAAENPAAFTPAPQRFQQEISTRFTAADGLGDNSVALIDAGPDGIIRAFAGGKWTEFREGAWREVPAMVPRSQNEFTLIDAAKKIVTVSIPWPEVRQILRQGKTVWLATAADPFILVNGKAESMNWPSRYRVNQMAAVKNGNLILASSAGLFQQREKGWSQMGIPDAAGRIWGIQEVLGVGVGPGDRVWFATKAGVAGQLEGGWRFFEGKDGLPWNDFTAVTVGPTEEIWFGTKLGLIRFDLRDWDYRQGPLWLPNDEVHQISIDREGLAWVATAGGVAVIERKKMSLAQKAAFYEEEISRFIKRTPFGYVAEAPLRKPGDKTTADPQDSDNDGLWTSMYGAGECFAFAATKEAGAQQRAKQAFEALRFLQKVTQGGEHSPPRGYVARTIRPADWPNPNAGRLESDRAAQKGDPLWKAYDPRWPKSADGKWYWKSDTSSDELDGHFFFYPLYYDFCADSAEEKERVREVVRDLADHLIEHNFMLIDHDGKPTRWGVFGPESLNRDPRWWPERGLNSLSILSYLAVAAHVTGDPKYEAASRDLIEKHGYAQNLMYPKVQNGAGSGNQSDDEMAFMSFYNLLRYSKDEQLRNQARVSFFRYWANEAPEMNPFFNFAYASQTLETTASHLSSRVDIKPWAGWLEDSVATLRGFPLDRLNWPHRNSHRLDIQLLGLERAEDIMELRHGRRGHRVKGKVLPVENRHFNHWNTDPWQLDYGGNGGELASGTVFLLPYYLGLYHGFIEKP